MTDYGVSKCSCGNLSAVYNWNTKKWERFEHDCPLAHQPKHAKPVIDND